jgi:hypothetical protein
MPSDIQTPTAANSQHSDGAAYKGTATYANYQTQVILGRSVGAKSSTEGGYVGRFAFDIPAGATITAVEWRSKTGVKEASATRLTDITVGFLKPDGLWDDTGFNATNYPHFNDVPMPQVNAQGAVDLTVWVSDSPAGVYSMNTADATWFTVGEGLSSDYEVVGLVDQLQQALDTYGSPFAFLATFMSIIGDFSNRGIFVFTNDSLNHPTLEIHWTLPPGEFTGTIYGTEVVSALYGTQESFLGLQPPAAALSGISRPSTALSGVLVPETLSGAVQRLTEALTSESPGDVPLMGMTRTSAALAATTPDDEELTGTVESSISLDGTFRTTETLSARSA